MEDLPLGPRAVYTADLIRFINENYRPGPIKTVEDIGGTYNLNLLLETAAQTFVLRVYRPWITRERLIVLQKIKEKLYKNHFPVVLPLTALSGQTVLEYQARLVEVEEYIPHGQFEPDWAAYQKLFASMAAFHDFLRESVDIASFVSPAVSNYAPPKVLLEWLGQFEEVVQDREAFEVCYKTRQILLRINPFFEEKVSNLPHQLTHGDWRAGNILFRNGQITGILDFDFLDMRERIFDLAYTLYWMFVTLEPGKAPEDLSWPKVGEMLRSYNLASSFKLSKDEIEGLPIELALVPLYWVGEALVAPGLIPTLPGYAKSVAMAEWILEHGSQLKQEFLP
ncbi:MAG: phosphotransferase [Chloroflexi bacterium]|nr:phosphotransferase [Chloroflexota bacterium]OJV92592.1 MAG: hypothetical protein BGO39_32350 [Chloroflexi bacterium 54-19]